MLDNPRPRSVSRPLPDLNLRKSRWLEVWVVLGSSRLRVFRKWSLEIYLDVLRLARSSTEVLNSTRLDRSLEEYTQSGDAKEDGEVRNDN
jgi:hypothetical protein